MDHSATAYFRKLSDLLFNIIVTDRQGSVSSLDEGMGRAVKMILGVAEKSDKVLLVGNGGSAAIVSHMQSDLGKGAGVMALVFNEAPLLTAFSNDIGYKYAFGLMTELFAKKGDLLLSISSSGQSPNIIRAVNQAVDSGCSTITLSGFKPDNPLRSLGDINFYVPADRYGYVEISHGTLAHVLSEGVMAARPRQWETE